MSTVQLGILVSYQETVSKFDEMPLKAVSGKKAFEIRKAIRAIQSELQSFNDARDQYIKENGEADEDGNVSIKDPEAMKKAQDFLNDMARSEVEITWKPILDDETMDSLNEHMEFTMRDLDFFEAAGLLQLEDEVREPEVEEA